MRGVHVHRHPNGPRLYVGGLRVHHGASGAAVAVLGLAARRRPLALVGVALAAHDAHDARVWFRVERLPSALVASGLSPKGVAAVAASQPAGGLRCRRHLRRLLDALRDPLGPLDDQTVARWSP